MSVNLRGNDGVNGIDGTTPTPGFGSADGTNGTDGTAGEAVSASQANLTLTSDYNMVLFGGAGGRGGAGGNGSVSGGVRGSGGDAGHSGDGGSATAELAIVTSTGSVNVFAQAGQGAAGNFGGHGYDHLMQEPGPFIGGGGSGGNAGFAGHGGNAVSLVDGVTVTSANGFIRSAAVAGHGGSGFSGGNGGTGNPAGVGGFSVSGGHGGDATAVLRDSVLNVTGSSGSLIIAAQAGHGGSGGDFTLGAPGSGPDGTRQATLGRPGGDGGHSALSLVNNRVNGTDNAQTVTISILTTSNGATPGGFNADGTRAAAGAAKTQMVSITQNQVHLGGGHDILNFSLAVAATGSVSVFNNIFAGGAGSDTLSFVDSRQFAPSGSIVKGIEFDMRINQVSGFELIIGSASHDTIMGNQEGMTYRMGFGNDLVVAGAGNDTFEETRDARDDDRYEGGGGVDRVTYELVTESVTIDLNLTVAQNTGGGGTDTLIGISNLTGGSGNDVLTGNGAANQLAGGAGNDVIDGGAGTDTLDGGDGNDTLNGGLGDDMMNGGAGDDILTIDSAGDVVIEAAGGGLDEVQTALATYTLGQHVERLVYTGSQAAMLRGNMLANRLTGSVAGDVLLLQDGGDDVALGGDGADGLYFGAALTALDIVDGGTGNDQLAIQGNYNLTLGAATLTGIETLALLRGNDTSFGDPGTNFYSYSLTSADANVAAGQKLTINANGLRLGENFTFDGSQESNGSFTFFGGAGTENLTGGAGSDGFFFGSGRFDPALDRVDGLQGGDDQMALRGNFAAQLVFAAATIANIDTIALISATHPQFGAPGQAFSYNLKTHDANLAAGAQLNVNGNGMAANEILTFDGSAETDGFFRIIAGRGADVLTGGAGNDLIFGGLGADQLTGNGGNDTFFYTAAAQSTAASRDTLFGFAAGDKIDLSAIDAVAGGANDAFTYIGGSAFSGAGQVRRVGVSGGVEYQADLDGDLNADLVIFVQGAGGYVPGGTDLIL